MRKLSRSTRSVRRVRRGCDNEVPKTGLRCGSTIRLIARNTSRIYLIIRRSIATYESHGMITEVRNASGGSRVLAVATRCSSIPRKPKTCSGVTKTTVVVRLYECFRRCEPHEAVRFI